VIATRAVCIDDSRRRKQSGMEEKGIRRIAELMTILSFTPFNMLVDRISRRIKT